MSTTDRDELADELFRLKYGRDEVPESFDQSRKSGQQEVADAILASDWLAARDARVREQAARDALDKVAREWQYGGWTILTAPPPAESIPSLALGQRVTDWLGERAGA